MNINDFFERVKNKKISSLAAPVLAKDALLPNEALFQIPFIAVSILVLSKQHAKPSTIEISYLLGECFEYCLKGYKDSLQQIGWSANLRIRTANAIGFLELVGLVEIESESKKIQATELGKKVIGVALSQESNLQIALNKIARAYNNLRKENQIRLGLE